MNAQMLEATLKVQVKKMRERLDQPAPSKPCANVLICEVNTLLNGTSLMNSIYLP